MSLETAALLSKTAAQLAEQALGPEKENRFTKINVIIGSYEDEEHYERVLAAKALGGPSPMPDDLTRPVLSDDTTGDTTDESGTKLLN
jgi:hypothetical protein